jgi:hypothetical protein
VAGFMGVMDRKKAHFHVDRRAPSLAERAWLAGARGWPRRLVSNYSVSVVLGVEIDLFQTLFPRSLVAAGGAESP